MNGETVSCIQGQSTSQQNGEIYSGKDQRNKKEFVNHSSGRFPANLIHDGSDDVVGLFPDKAGGGFGKRGPNRSMDGWGMNGKLETVGFGDSGGAARFFYCAKASKADRGDGNRHPTVKPTGLMRYLCRLVTPPGGVVLDPFMGSGSTGKAAILERLRFVGAEIDLGSFAIAYERIALSLPSSNGG